VATIALKSLESKKLATIGSKSLEIPRFSRDTILGDSIIAGRRVDCFFIKQLGAHKSRFSSDLGEIVASFAVESDFVDIVASGSSSGGDSAMVLWARLAGRRTSWDV
jgi:hypothetical protein